MLISVSCTIQKDEESNKTVIVINESLQDTLTVFAPAKEIVVLSKQQSDLINTFRPFVKDAAYFLLTHKQIYKMDRFVFICGRYNFWIANGYDCFHLYRPVDLDLTYAEKQYFWKIFQEYKNTELRTYVWEDEIEIVIK